ncbi:MAG: flagellar export protein FliJ [Candidatus Rifleibacteriota bacterium]
MAFKFRFQQILQICIHEENEVKNQLARKDGQISEANASIRKFKDEYATALQNKIIDLQNGDMLKLQMYPAYLARLQKSWEFHEEELERLIKQREKIMQELMQKRRNRKTYEKMRENDEAVWRKEQQKREQRNLDEFGSRLKTGRGENSDA